MRTTTRSTRTGSATLGTLFGAILGGLISLLVVLVSFGVYKERIDNLRTEVDDLKQQSTAGTVRLTDAEIREQLEAFCRRHPDVCGGRDTDPAVHSQMLELEQRINELEQAAPSAGTIPPDALPTVQPGQLLLEEGAVSIHLKQAVRKTSELVRVELQLVPRRDVTMRFDLQYAVGIRAVDMQGRDYKANPIEFAGATNRGEAKLMSGTTVPLVLNFPLPSEVESIRTIRSRIAFDQGSWQPVETPPIRISD